MKGYKMKGKYASHKGYKMKGHWKFGTRRMDTTYYRVGKALDALIISSVFFAILFGGFYLIENIGVN